MSTAPRRDNGVAEPVDGACHRSSGHASAPLPAAPLVGVRVLVLTSGHDVTDARVHGRQAAGARRLGADVTLVGKVERGAPSDVRTLAVAAPGSRVSRFLWQPWRCVWTARAVEADIIHFHDAEMLLTLPAARLWWRRARFVYDVHEDFGNLLLVRDWLPGRVRPVVKALTDGCEKALASLAHAIVGVTEPLADKFSNHRRIAAHNYVSRDFLERASAAALPPRRREFDLVHLGTLSATRAAFLAETIRRLHELRPYARSLVVGVSRDVEEILTARVPERCTVLGRRPHAEIAALLGNARVGIDVHPVLKPHLAVALPVKVCEYMAAGCAVVSSAMPVLERVLSESGADAGVIKLIEGGDPADYARAVVRWIEAIEAGEDPGSRLQRIASAHLTWDAEVVKLARLYLELLDKPCAI